MVTVPPCTVVIVVTTGAPTNARLTTFLIGLMHDDSLRESFASTSMTLPLDWRCTLAKSSTASPRELQYGTGAVTLQRVPGTIAAQSASVLQTRANSWQSWLGLLGQTMNEPP